jgi:hypothetical protein
MADMARPGLRGGAGGGHGRPRTARPVAVAVALLAGSAALVACTDDAPERPADRSPSPVALSVRTVHADALAG